MLEFRPLSVRECSWGDFSVQDVVLGARDVGKLRSEGHPGVNWLLLMVEMEVGGRG